MVPGSPLSIREQFEDKLYSGRLYYRIIDSGYEVRRTDGGNAVLRGKCVCIFYVTGQVPVPTILPPTPCSPI